METLCASAIKMYPNITNSMTISVPTKTQLSNLSSLNSTFINSSYSTTFKPISVDVKPRRKLGIVCMSWDGPLASVKLILQGRNTKVTVFTKRHSESLYGSIDMVSPIIQRKLRKIKDKETDHGRHMKGFNRSKFGEPDIVRITKEEEEEIESAVAESEKDFIVEEKSSTEPDTVDDKSSQAATSSTSPSFPEFPNKEVNKRVALLSTFAAVGLFLSARLDFGVSLRDVTAMALPYEEALSNGKPTVVEFYADWCEVCRELAPDVYKVEQQYKDQVNFVMLNVDNTKWEQELDEFGVEGIPHFAFLDKNGNEEGNVVGRLPRKYLLENVDALARGEESIPHARVVGQYSSAEFRKIHQVGDPRSHG